MKCYLSYFWLWHILIMSPFLILPTELSLAAFSSCTHYWYQWQVLRVARKSWKSSHFLQYLWTAIRYKCQDSSWLGQIKRTDTVSHGSQMCPSTSRTSTPLTHLTIWDTLLFIWVSNKWTTGLENGQKEPRLLAESQEDDTPTCSCLRD